MSTTDEEDSEGRAANILGEKETKKQNRQQQQQKTKTEKKTKKRMKKISTHPSVI